MQVRMQCAPAYSAAEQWHAVAAVVIAVEGGARPHLPVGEDAEAGRASPLFTVVLSDDRNSVEEEEEVGADGEDAEAGKASPLFPVVLSDDGNSVEEEVGADGKVDEGKGDADDEQESPND
jgi:TATA-binding protein-associated factor Taf7